jgi:hypothetical protein
MDLPEKVKVHMVVAAVEAAAAAVAVEVVAEPS